MAAHRASLGSLLFFVLAPGTTAGLAPWLLTGWSDLVGGLYRWVRNPMYVGVAGAIAGQAVMFGSLEVWLWFGAFVLAVTSFVRFYEEPTLRRTYGAQYLAYAGAVHRWLPRLRPWRPERFSD